MLGEIIVKSFLGHPLHGLVLVDSKDPQLLVGCIRQMCRDRALAHTAQLPVRATGLLFEGSCATVVHGSAGWTHWPPSPIRVHAMRTDSGRPSSSMRFRAWTAMVTSVA